MKGVLYLDVETYSDVDLTKYGVYRYAESPAFEILMAAWSLDGSETRVAGGREEVEAIPGLRDPSVLKVAHNAQFERVCFSAFFGLPAGQYLDPEEWEDTAALAAVAGYPRGLGALAVALGVQEKDEAGTAPINWFCKPDRKGQRRSADVRPVSPARGPETVRRDEPVCAVHGASNYPLWPCGEAVHVAAHIEARDAQIRADECEQAAATVRARVTADNADIGPNGRALERRAIVKALRHRAAQHRGDTND